MPFYKCAVDWCQCTPISKKSCLFGLPKGERLKKKWLRFVADSKVTKAKDRKVPNTVMICNKHFPKSSFENLYQFEMGFAMRLILKSGAVPVSPEVLKEETFVAWTSYENNSSASSSTDRKPIARSNVPALKKLQISMAAPGKSNYSIPPSKSIIPKVSAPPALTGKVHSLLSQVSDSSHIYKPVLANFSQNYDCDDENTNSEECIGVRSVILRKQAWLPSTTAKTSIGLQSDRLQITKDVTELGTISSTSSFSQIKAIKKKSYQFGAEDVLRYFLTGKSPALDFVSLKQFWQYASNFRLSGQGDLMRKLSNYTVGARLKFVILSPERKQQIFDYFRIGKNSISTECQIIARYFWWPNLRDDIKKFISEKTSTKAKKEVKDPELPIADCSSNVGSTEGEQVSFLKGFNLKLASDKVEVKAVDTTRWDHDYTADRLTVKRMLCAKYPDSAPANKKAKKSAQDVTDNTNKATLYKKIISSSEDSDSDNLNRASSSYSEKITRVQPETFPILPQPENLPFIRLLGLELVSNRLNRTKELAPTVPNTCMICTTDYTVTWHKASGGVLCHKCNKGVAKKALAKKRKLIDPVHYHPVKAQPSHPRPLQYLAQEKSPSLKPMVIHHHVKELPPKSNAPSKVQTNVPPRSDKQPSLRITMSKEHFNSINNKISLMDAANKIRDHINSRLLELKSKPKAPAKQEEPITIQQRLKPPSSVELLRSMRQSQRKPVVLVKKVRKYNYHRTSKGT